MVCTGDNSLGQLGNGTTAGAFNLTAVSGIDDATRIACGAQHACPWRRDGTISCWGRSLEGQILGASGMMQTSPVPEIPVELALGRLHSCAILETQRIVCGHASRGGRVSTTR